MTHQSTSPGSVSGPSVPHDSSVNGKLLHSLSNKLLPIVVFSELALRRCEDEHLKQQLEKIHGAAEQARDILVEIRGLQASTKI
ncbi:MAG: hypothetical protein OEY80_02175 [Nitrospirota bacterium]|nr:hypothetical protein [Nitrospirota bacterium]MDH4359854.1 hypothetical protein [Nitrospirota bacterium]MDH5574271.1 hypothetical protein [Nitrospirota bacterium]